MTSRQSIRDLLVEQAAVETARAWIEEVHRELIREHREIDGAWPGTLTEARARAGGALRRAAQQRELPGPGPEELERVAQLTTAEARRGWRKVVGRGAT